jgi:predicted amidohydrolase YtcJ
MQSRPAIRACRPATALPGLLLLAIHAAVAQPTGGINEASVGEGSSPGATATASPCHEERDLLLTNGRIYTMNDASDVTSAVRILGNRIVALGEQATGVTDCTTVLDLDGRTAIPGIIDNHNHIVLLGLRPGHDTRLENAQSIDDVLATLATRAARLPAGEWITSIGGFDINQFVPPPAPPRFPTLAELDGAVPNHPVYLQQSFSGPAVTNSLGRTFFLARGVAVADDGAIAGGFELPNPSTRALHALRELQTLDDQIRGTRDALRYSASVGVTTHLDQGGFEATGYCRGWCRGLRSGTRLRCRAGFASGPAN